MAPTLAREDELEEFHTMQYIKFLKNWKPDSNNRSLDSDKRNSYGLEAECPMFEGYFAF